MNTLNLYGLLPGHSGWAGPDLLSVTRNLFHTKYFLARLVSENAILWPYSHHPPIGFWIFKFTSFKSFNFSESLNVAYLTSISMFCIGWLYLLYLGLKINSSKLDTLITLFLVSACPMFVENKLLTNFDSLSVISSAMILHSMILIDKLKDDKINFFKKKIILSLSLFLIPMLISWYSVPIVITYLTLNYFNETGESKNFFKKLLLLALSFFIIEIIIIIFLIYLNVNSLESLISFFLLNTSIRKHPGRIFSVFEAIKRLSFNFFSSMPYLFYILFFLIAYFKKIDLKSLFYKNKIIRLILIFIAGLFIFVLATRIWSAIHPFAFIFMSGPIFLLSSILIKQLDLKFNYKIILLIFSMLFFTISYYNQYQKDLSYSKDTLLFLETIDKYLPKGTSIKTDFETQCGKITPGALFYISSFPNFTFSTNQTNQDKFIEIKCLDQNIGIFLITDFANKKIININLADKNVKLENFK